MATFKPTSLTQIELICFSQYVKEHCELDSQPEPLTGLEPVHPDYKSGVLPIKTIMAYLKLLSFSTFYPYLYFYGIQLMNDNLGIIILNY